jgi:hypothetical protein
VFDSEFWANVARKSKPSQTVFVTNDEGTIFAHLVVLEWEIISQ